MSKFGFNSWHMATASILIAIIMPVILDKGYHEGGALTPIILWISGPIICSLLFTSILLTDRLKSIALPLLKLTLLFAYEYGIVLPLCHAAHFNASNTALCVIGAAGVAVWIHFRAHRNLTKIAIATALAYALAPIGVSTLGKKSNIPILTLQVSAAGNDVAKLVIVLDETSPEHTDVLANAIKSEGLIVSHHVVSAAGANTINAIPSMLTGVRHDDVTVCGPHSLCGDESLDFSSLKATNPATDIVGFYHPYCAIAGLRSCMVFRFNRVGLNDYSLPRWLAKKICDHVHNFSDSTVCRQVEEWYQNYVKNMRLNMIATIDRAPFWQEKGVLYIHMPLPHPPSNDAQSTLELDYKKNITLTEQLLKSLARKLKLSFGHRFLLIVTSDHPLRPGVWCNPEAYAEIDCMKNAPADGSKVPLIYATGEPMVVQWPNTNLGILK